MSDIESAYQSLDKAKKEREELVKQVEEYDEVYNILEPYCNGSIFARYRSIREQIETFKFENRDKVGSILFITVIYLFGFGFVDFVSVFLAGNIGVVVPSIIAFVACVAASTPKFFNEIRKNGKKIKELAKIERGFGKNTIYSRKSIQQLVNLLAEAMEILKGDIDNLDEAIKEYEENLSKANETLAEEVLANSGIDVTINLKSNMKVLAKRYGDKNEQH